MNLKCLFGFHHYIQLTSHLGNWIKEVPRKYYDQVQEHINNRLSPSQMFYASTFLIERCNDCGNLRVKGVHSI